MAIYCVFGANVLMVLHIRCIDFYLLPINTQLLIKLRIYHKMIENPLGFCAILVFWEVLYCAWANYESTASQVFMSGPLLFVENFSTVIWDLLEDGHYHAHFP